MKINTKIYKTNINCGNCLSKVQPKLDAVEGIDSWSVDLVSEERFLTVQGSEESLEKVVAAVGSAGFKAEVRVEG